MKKVIVVVVIIAVFGAAIGAMSTTSFAQSFLNRSSEEATAEAETLPAVTAPDTVLAEAKIVPMREADLSLAVSGIVAEVFASEGQRVQAGDVLLRLDSVRQEAAVAQAEANLLNAELQVADLQAPPRSEEIARSQAAVAAAQASLQKLLDGARDVELTSARVDLANAEAALREAQAAYDDVSWRTDIAMLPQSTALEQATNNFVRAQAALDDVRAGADAQDIAAAQAQVRSAQADLNLLQAGATAESIAAAQAQVKVAQAALADARAALEQMTLSAPFDGTLALLNVEVGEQVSPGLAVAKLADLSGWRLETDDLTELSVVRIQEGDQVTIELDALPELELTGRVQSIRPLGENKQGDITYTVLATLDEQSDQLRWNMTAEAMILPDTAPARGVGSASIAPPADALQAETAGTEPVNSVPLAQAPDAASEMGPAQSDAAADMVEGDLLPELSAGTSSLTLAAEVATQGVPLNVRSGPGTDYPVLAGAPNGTTMTALARSEDGEWLQAELASGETGWVFAQFVRLSEGGDVDSLDVAGEPVLGEEQPAQAPAAVSSRAVAQPVEVRGMQAEAGDGLLVFQASSGGMIYVYDLGAEVLRELTVGLDPALSPDGTTVAFVREGGEHGLYLIGTDGANERRIFNGGENFRAPAWSPDGQWIAFSRQIGSYDCRDVGGGVCVPDNPFLSDFGLVSQAQTMLSRVDVNGQNFQDLPSLTTARAATWGDAGIVYQSAAGLQITQDAPRASTQPIVNQFRYQDPDVQINGDRIVFHSLEGNRREIFTVNTDGSGLVALTRPVDPLAKEYPQNVAPVWSADGQRIAFLSNRTEDGGVGDWGIWTMDANGGDLRPVPVGVPIAYAFQNEQALSW